jgi:hypothetical protein
MAVLSLERRIGIRNLELIRFRVPPIVEIGGAPDTMAKLPGGPQFTQRIEPALIRSVAAAQRAARCYGKLNCFRDDDKVVAKQR